MNNSIDDQFEKNIKCLQGSFSVEGIELSDQTRINLHNLSQKKTHYKELISQISKKYSEKR